MKLISILICATLLSGCVTVQTKDGTRVTATGNAKISVDTNGVLTVENSGTAEAYGALGDFGGKIAEGTARGLK